MEIYKTNRRSELSKLRDVITDNYRNRTPIITPDTEIVLDGNRLDEYKLRLYPAMRPHFWDFVNLLGYKLPLPVKWECDLDYNRFNMFEYWKEKKEVYNGHTIKIVPTRYNCQYISSELKGISITPTALEIIVEALDVFTAFDEFHDKLVWMRANTELANEDTNPDFTGWCEKYPPFPHQRVTLEFVRRFPNALILNEQGTGKTYAAIAYAQDLINKNEIDNAVVICPKNIAKSVWLEQVVQFSDLVPEIIQGTPKKRSLCLHANAHIFIIGYELAARMKGELERYLITDRTLLIADEITKIKNPTAKRSKAIHRFGRIAKLKIGMTGTPCTQSPADLFSMMKFIDGGDTFGINFDEFARKYFTQTRYGQVGECKMGAIEEISNAMYRKSIRYEKEDVLRFLPPKLYQRCDVPMTKYQEKIYKQMAITMEAEMEGQMLSALAIITKLLRLHQITGGYVKLETGEVKEISDGNPKKELCLEMIEEFVEAGDSVIVWCRFIPEIQNLTYELEQRGIPCGTFYSGTSESRRMKNVEDFEQGRIKVFVSQPQSGGMGLNLFVANKAIFYSNVYSYEGRAQAEDRCHRSGSEKHEHIMYFDLCCVYGDGKRTIDHSFLDILMEKKDIADAITKDRRDWKDLI